MATAVVVNAVRFLILIVYILYPVSCKQIICEKVTIPMCRNLGYNLTYMPNMFNHSTQGEAGLEVRQFLPLVKSGCSPDLRFFLCSMYAPVCNQQYMKELPPCKSLCKRVRKGCGPVMRRFDFRWPKKMKCSKFPKMGNKKSLCFDRNITDCREITSNENVVACRERPSKPVGFKQLRCEKVTIPMCRNVGYNLTYMPNMFNHSTQAEAALQVHQFWPLVEIGCSPDLRFFLCLMYAPVCDKQYMKELPPCKTLCKRARKGCEHFMRHYGFRWPERFDCSNFPGKRERKKLCLDRI